MTAKSKRRWTKRRGEGSGGTPFTFWTCKATALIIVQDCAGGACNVNHEHEGMYFVVIDEADPDGQGGVDLIEVRTLREAKDYAERVSERVTS